MINLCCQICLQDICICGKIQARRRRLPDERRAITHHFTIGGEHDGYITVGLYENKKPGEIFVKMSKQGSTISGLLDCWAITMSLAIQYGVPLESLCAKLAYTRFEPDGNTQTPLHFATSVVDYVVRWLQMRFIENGTGPEEEKRDESGSPSDLR